MQLLPTTLRTTLVSFLMDAAGMDEYQKRFQQFDPALATPAGCGTRGVRPFGDGILAYGAANSGAVSIAAMVGPNDLPGIRPSGNRAGSDSSPTSIPRSGCRHSRKASGRWLETSACGGHFRMRWSFRNGPSRVQRGAKGALTMVFSDGFKAEPYAPKVKPTAPKTKVKADDLLSVALHRDPQARIELLRKRSPQTSTLRSLHVAGERESVWKELVALGPDVRSSSHAADALAVAYETMTRVDQNVRTLVQRLKALGYRFQFEAHTPPDAKTWKAIQKFEKLAGLLAAFVSGILRCRRRGRFHGLASRGRANRIVRSAGPTRDLRSRRRACGIRPRRR